MRRQMLAVPMMLLLCLLCACGGKAQDPLQAPMDHRAALLARGGCAFTLEAQAQTGDRLWPLRLDCELDQDGNGSVTVLAPESIAGIQAVSREDGTRLEYQGVRLALGTLPGTELAPAGAPGRLVRAWSRDWIASAGQESQGLRVCYEDGPVTVLTWFDADNLPLRAELAVDGSLCFSAEIRNFTWKAGIDNETTEENLG